MSSSTIAAPWSAGRYAAAAMALHWIIAVAIAVQIGLGWYMGSLEDKAAAHRIEPVHISVGLTVLILTVARLVLALTRRPPPLPTAMAGWERSLASVVHGLFYVMLFVLPLSGWVMESIGPRPIPFWGAAWPHFPGLDVLLAGQDRRMVKDTIEGAHGSLLVWIMLGLIALHVAGAIKHQFDGTPILWRMAPFLRRPGQP